MHKSETSKAREVLSKFCKGYGVDIGFGGDKIIPSAIGIDLDNPYTKTGDDPVQLGGDARKLKWFRDGVLDWVYSSHLLEDFENTTEILKEWARVLKRGGALVLYLPDEQAYREYSKKRGVGTNPAHKNEFFNLAHVEVCAIQTDMLALLYKTDIVVDYSFAIVFTRK